MDTASLFVSPKPGHDASDLRLIQWPLPPAPGWRSRRDHEIHLQAMWEQLFGISPIGIDDNFFDIGGHSLLAMRLLMAIQRSTHQTFTLGTLLQSPTIRQLAGVIDAGAWEVPVPLVQLKPGAGRPFFLVHSLAGTFLELWAVLRALETSRPVLGLQARGLVAGQAPHLRVGDMASEYIEHMRCVQPSGPYALGGYSFGGLVAFEMAQQLCRDGESVELLALIDTHAHGRYLPLGQWLRYCVERTHSRLRTLMSLPGRERIGYLQKKATVLVDRIRARFGLVPSRPDLVGDIVREANLPPTLRRVRGAMLLAMRDYRPQPYPGKAVFLRAAGPGEYDPLPLWRKVMRGGLEVVVTPGNHDEMICGANATALAQALARHF